MLILWFILVAVAMRFLPHAWDFTPVIAMLLLAGAWMSRKWLWVPVMALMASDFVLNVWVYHYAPRADQYFTWAAYLMVLGLAVVTLHGKVRVPRLLGATVLSSFLFFLVSNFGVWIAGDMYPHTMAGLAACYAMGIPFYRAAAVGDLLFVAVFFGAYALIQHQLQLRGEARSAA